MPRTKKPKVNKTALIKELTAKGLANKDVVAEAAKQGVKFSAAYVSTVKANTKKGNKSKTAKKGRGRGARGGNGHGSMESLLATVEFVKAVGGIDRAKQSLELLESFSGLN